MRQFPNDNDLREIATITDTGRVEAEQWANTAYDYLAARHLAGGSQFTSRDIVELVKAWVESPLEAELFETYLDSLAAVALVAPARE
jgi:hypothetical protein